MPISFRQTIQDILSSLPTRKLDALKQLFWSELNYDRSNEPLSTRDWPSELRGYLEDPPILFATAGDDDGFHLIYCRLSSERLLLTRERPVIARLLNEQPYSLFVFSDRSQTNWHFVNVKYDQDGEARARRVFRRITVGPSERLRTATERLAMLDVAALSPRLTGVSALALQQRHDEAFDVEAVTRDFFRTYRVVFEQVEASVTGLVGEQRRLFTQRLFNRLLFIVFLERKGWLTFDGKHDYLQTLWEDHRRQVRSGTPDNFYRDRLKLLFFAGLNTPHEVNVVDITRRGVIASRIGQVPYLNGGLFEEQEEDKDAAITLADSMFRLILADLLYHYNFTVTESTPLDVEVAVDPEMLGKTFEELVTGRHESGSYYTPKPAVSFMCQEALKGYLQTACPSETSEAITAFVEAKDASGLRNPESVLAALKAVRACDPACGSGAYLVGMMHELLELRQALFTARHVDPLTTYQRKLEIIQNNLYGVDIDPFAVNIARLRLWLSLIVDFEGDTPPPLPNLDFKIEVGDSLLGPDPSGGLQPDMFRQHQIEEYFQLKNEYLQAHGSQKLMLRGQIDAVRAEIREWAHQGASNEGFDWAVEFAEVFVQGGFHIILANPPYVRQELIKDLKPALRERFAEVYDGRADLYVYFYARAIQLLRPLGMLIFISSNKWLRARYGKGLRSYIAASGALADIIDFGELPVFETAATFPMILLFKKGSEQVVVRFTQVKSLDYPYPYIRLLVEGNGVSLSRQAVSGDAWTLSDATSRSVVQRMAVGTIPLASYASNRIYWGVKTGLNDAFVIDGQTRAGLVMDDPRSAEIIKQLAVGTDVRRWRIGFQDRWIIFTFHGIEIDQYPAVKDYLRRFRKRLEQRATSHQHFWYELQQPQMGIFREFDKDKIVYPEISKEPRFAFDQSKCYTNNKTFFVPCDDLYLLGVLNSSTAWLYLRNTCSVLGDPDRGGRLELRTEYMSKLPIPVAPKSEQIAVADLVEHVIDLIEQSGQSAELEREIDRRVAMLYGLKFDEIADMESSTS